jgi:hypothetical protein
MRDSHQAVRFDFVPDASRMIPSSDTVAIVRTRVMTPRFISVANDGPGYISRNSAGSGSGWFLSAWPQPCRRLIDFMDELICHGLLTFDRRGALPERT